MASFLTTLLKFVKVFSSRDKFRKYRFITINFSHYCEKSRWALRLSPLGKEIRGEEMHCPAFHLSSTLDLLQTQRISPWNECDDLEKEGKKPLSRVEKTAVPKLVLNKNGQTDLVISDGSNGINKYLFYLFPDAMMFLYPSVKAIELENYFDNELGPAVSLWSFGNLLLSGKSYCNSFAPSNNEELVNSSSVDYVVNQISIMTPSVSKIESILFRLLGRLYLIPLMIKANKVTGEKREESLEKIRNVFKLVDSIIQSNELNQVNGKYLLGTDKPSACDIALAALAAPLIFPMETQQYFGSIAGMKNEIKKHENCPEKVVGLERMIQVAEELRATKTGDYILHVFKNHHYSHSVV